MLHMAELSRENPAAKGDERKPLFETENAQEANLLSVMSKEQQVDYGRGRILKDAALKADSIRLATAEEEIRKMAPEMAQDLFGSAEEGKTPAKPGLLDRFKNLFN